MKVRQATRLEVAGFVRRHYLHRWPAVVVCILGLEDDDCSLVGVCIFALPPRETNRRYNVAQSLELARLFVEDWMPRNTESWFIARALRWLKQNRPQVELVISYADPSAGHVGTIYKASNWIADGRTDQERKSPRCDYVVQDWFGSTRYGRRAHCPCGLAVERVPRSSKWRFIYKLT